MDIFGKHHRFGDHRGHCRNRLFTGQLLRVGAALGGSLKHAPRRHHAEHPRLAIVSFECVLDREAIKQGPIPVK